MRTIADRLPTFPWDTLAGARERARAHPDGFCDLTVGSPVDPAPRFAIAALTRAADAHAYPTVVGTADLGAAMRGYLHDRWRVTAEVGTLPVIGTKEFVASLPTHLGLGPGDVVVHPTTAYPTYAVGARLAGAEAVACDDPADLDARAAGLADQVALVWLNSPGNPDGRVLDADTLRAWVAWCREHDAVLASDECYGEFGWDAEPVSVLDPAVCGDASAQVVAIFSESKRSNLAGYRAGFCAGDPELIAGLTHIRRHGGMMMPTPVQAAMAQALGERQHVVEQRERYHARRGVLRQALVDAGWRIDHSAGGLYLWVTRDDVPGSPGAGDSGAGASRARAIVDCFAERGILVTPGDFYGEDEHVRITTTATDAVIARAAARITGS